MAGTAHAVITPYDNPGGATGWSGNSVTPNPFSEPFTINANANVLVLDIGWRNGAQGQVAPLSDISIGGVSDFSSWVLAANVSNTNQTVGGSAVYYLFNPPTGPVTVAPTFIANDASQDFSLNYLTLGGVNTNIAGIGFSQALASGTTNTVTVNSVSQGSAAVIDMNVRQGGGPYSYTGTGGTGTSQWLAPATANNTGGGGYVTGLAAGNDVIGGTVTSNGNNRFAMAGVVFAPAPTGLNDLPQVTWTGGTDNTWGTTGGASGNWSGNAGNAPDGTKEALFNATSAAVNGNTTLSIAGTVTVGQIKFDTAAAAPYTLGTSAGTGTIALTGNNVQDNAGVAISSTVTANQIINSNISLANTANSNSNKYNIVNGSSTATLAIAGGIDNAAGQGSNTLLFSGSGVSVSGVIANSTGAIALSSGGTLTLSNAETYTGATTVTGGTLHLTGSLGNTVPSVTSGTLSLEAANAITQNTVTVGGGTLAESVTNALSGSAALTITSGTANLSQANNYMGATNISGGTLQVSNTGATASSSALNLNAGGTYALRSDTPQTFQTPTIGGSADIDVNNFSTATGKTLSVGALSLGAFTLTASGGNGYVLGTGAITLTGNGGLAATTANFNVPSVTGTTRNLALSGTSTTASTVGAITTGSGTLTVTGGVWNLTGTSTYTGATAVSGGTLNLTTGSLAATAVTISGSGVFEINNNASIASVTALNLNGGTYALRSDSSAAFTTPTIGGSAAIDVNALTAAYGQTLSIGAISLGNGINLTATGGNGYFLGTGAITLTGASATLTANTASFTIPSVTGNANLTLSGGTSTGSTIGAITTGAHTLTVSGGTWALTGASTYTGGTTLSGGVAQVDATENAPTSGPLGANGNTITFSGGTLQYSAANTFDYSSRFSTASGQSYNIDTNGQTVSFGTGIGSASSTLTKLGLGTLALNAANNALTSITLNGGTLALNNNSALGNSSGTFNIGSTTGLPPVAIDNTSNSPLTIATNNPESWSNSFTFIGSNDLNLGNGTLSLPNSITVTVNNGNLTAPSGVDTGTQTLYKDGPGTLVMTNTPIGQSIILGQNNNSLINGQNQAHYSANGGTLKIGGSATLTNATPVTIYQNSNLTLDNSTTNTNNRLVGNSLNLGGGTLTINGNSLNPTTETIGTIVAGEQGGAYGAQSGGATIALVPNSAQNITLTASNATATGPLVINNAQILFKGTNLGVNTIASATAGASNIAFTGTFSNNPTPILVGNGGASGTTDMSVFMRAIGDNVVGGVDHYGLVTYDTNNGVRLLNTSTEYATSLASGANDTNNYLLSSGTTVTINSGTTINSLTLSNGTTVSGTGNLGATSDIYAANGGTNTIAVNALVGANNNQSLFYVMGSSTVLNLNTNITSGNTEIFGQGTLVFNGANTANGNFMVNGGTLRAGSSNWISPNLGGFSISGGATVDLNGFNSTIYPYGNGFDGSGTITNSGAPAILTLMGDQNIRVPFVGNINGGANLALLKSSPYQMEIGGGGNYSGGLIVNSGILQLDTAAALGSNTAITIGGNSLSLGVLGIPVAPASQAALNISPSSSGVLALDDSNNTFTATLNMATLGNGSMFLGAVALGYNPSTVAGTYSAATLGVGAGNIYRLGGGNAALAFTSGGVLAAGTNLVVGQVGGTRNINAYLPYGVMGAQGTVKFNTPQGAFNGTVTVNGGTNDNGGNNGWSSTTLEFVVPNTSGQVIGSGNTNVTLNGGVVQFDPPNTANATVSMGTITANGGPAGVATGGTNSGTVITLANMVRNNNSAFYIGAGNNLTQQSSTVIGPTGTEFKVANSSGMPGTAIGNIIPAGNTVTNGMVTYGGNVAPWIIYSVDHSGGEFLAYTSSGFAPTVYTLNGVARPANGSTGFVDGASTLLSSAAASDIVAFQPGNGTGDSSIHGSKTIYALSIFFGTGTRGPSITSDGTGPATLTITSGALSQDIQNGGVQIGSTTAASALNVTFGAEAVIYDGLYNGQGNFNLLNTVTAPSLTKIGPGNLSLDNASATTSGTANPISGTITIDSGSITTGQNNSNEFSLGNGNNVVLNGGQWAINGNNGLASVSHNIQVGPAGGILSTGAFFSTSYSGSITDLVSPDGTKAGPLSIIVSNNGNNSLTLTDNNPSDNSWSGGTLVQGGTLTVASGVNFGTGPVDVATGVLTLMGNNNLNPTISSVTYTPNLTVEAGATANFQSAAPVLGSLDGSGSVVLGATGPVVNTNLIVGGSSRSTTFYGAISQVTGATGAVTKTGTGTMTLAGVSTYGGLTTVNAGTLRIANTGALSGNGGAAVNNGTLSVLGKLTGNGTVTVGDQVATHAAFLSGSGTIAGPVIISSAGSGTAGTIIGATGATLTLTGGLTLNNGAISNFSISSAAPNPSGPAQIATSGGVGTSLSFPGGAVDTVNVTGTATVGQTFDLFSYTGTDPTLANFSLGSTPNIPGAAFAISINTMTTPKQVDLIVNSSNTDYWTNDGSAPGPSNPGRWDIGVTENWARTVMPTGPTTYTDGDNVVFQDTDVNTSMTLTSPQMITVASTVNPQTVVFSNNAVSYSIGGAAISGTASLTVNGGGSVTLTGSSNSYSGGTIVTNGTLTLTTSSTGLPASVSMGPVGTAAVQLGNGGGGNAATLYLGAASSTGGLTLANAITVVSGSSGLLTIGGQNTSGTNTYSGAITLNQSATASLAAGTGTLAFTGNIAPGASGTLTFAPGAGATITSGTGTGVIGGGTGTLAVTQNGAGTTILSGANTYGGATTVTTGTLRVAGSLAGNGNIAVNNGAALQVPGSITGNGTVAVNNGTMQVNGSLSGSGAVTIGDQVMGHAATLSGSGSIAAAVALSGPGASGTGGAINGASNFVFSLNGGLTLNDGTSSNFALTAGGVNNGSTGLIATSGGAGNSLVFASGTHTINLSGTAAIGTYDLYSFTDSVAPAGTFAKGTNTISTGGLAYAISVTSNQVDLVVTQGTASSQWDFAGDGNYGDSTKWQFGTFPNGTVAQPQTATFATGSTGEINSTNVPSGMLTVGNNVNPVSPHLGGIVFDNAQVSYTLSSGPITLNNNNMGATIEVDHGSHTITSNLTVTDSVGLTFNPTISGDLLTVSGTLNNGNNPLFVAGAGNTTLNGAISGSGNLTMNGTGILTLGATNSYGNTSVNSGTLTTAATSGALAGGSLTMGNAIVNIGGSESITTLSTTSASGSLRIGASGNLSVNAASGNVIAPITVAGGTFTMAGTGTMTITAAPILDANSNLAVSSSGGKLVLNISSNPTVQANVTATVASGATLELAGTTSALADPTALSTFGPPRNASQRVEVQNSGTLQVDDGAVQQVGGIDGTGSVVVGSSTGASLTANHIIQNSLTISAGSTFTLAPSDPSGLPSAAGGLVLAGSLTPSSSFLASSGSLLGAGGASSLASPSLGGGLSGASVNAVPEPSSIALALLAAIGLLVTSRFRRNA